MRFKILLICFLLISGCGKKSDPLLDLFVNHTIYILNSCKVLKVKSRIYVATIYGEIYDNYNFFDHFDNIRAKLGFDPSVGFAQMRVSTFKWIEDNYADGKIIKMSSSRDEMIRKLIADSTNILYSVFYVKLIHDKLQNKFNNEPSIKLLASYYGRGIDYYRADELDSTYYNQIGITAEEFYKSDNLINYFPK